MGRETKIIEEYKKNGTGNSMIDLFIENKKEVYEVNEKTLAYYIEYTPKYVSNMLQKEIQDITVEDIEKIDSLMIKKYLNNLKSQNGEKYKPRTLNKIMTSIVEFYNFACDRYRLLNRLHDLKSYKTVEKGKEKEVRALSKEQVERLINIVDGGTTENYEKYIMHRYIIYMLLYTGLRVEEFVNLRWSNIVGNILHVRGKGNKYRKIPMIQKVKEVLEDMARLTHHEFGDDSLILDIGIRQVQNIVAKYTEMSGYKTTPHGLRHTFATLLVREGENIVDIKEYMGHGSISTTQIYFDMVERDYSNSKIHDL